MLFIILIFLKSTHFLIIFDLLGAKVAKKKMRCSALIFFNKKKEADSTSVSFCYALKYVSAMPW